MKVDLSGPAVAPGDTRDPSPDGATVTACPLCGSREIEVFFAMRDLPVHGQAVCRTQAEAKALGRGDQVLAVCHGCALVFNVAFDPDRLDYSGAHEESQSFSPAFRAFATELAEGWVRRYGLEDELVVEIGCGKGDFLQLLSAAGVGRAHGIDPGIDLERLPEGGRVTGEKRWFAPSEVTRSAAAVVCRHTLEHIPAVSEFLAGVRAGVDRERCRALLFEVPDLSRVLAEGAFWDLQYEHCSSFTAGSLKAAFERQGFTARDLRLVYGGQYLVIEADPAGRGDTGGRELSVPTVPEVVEACRSFAAAVDARIAHWSQWFLERRAAGREAVVWGGGAKGVVFLNCMPENAVRRVVDINEGLHGNWLGGVGAPIVAPRDLVADPPDSIVLMNEIYLDEVRGMLDGLGLTEVELLAL